MVTLRRYGKHFYNRFGFHDKFCMFGQKVDCQTTMSIVFTMCFQSVCLWISTKSVLVSPWISSETLWIWGMFPAVWVVKESVFSLTVQTVVQWGAPLRTELDWQTERESLYILKLYSYRTLNRRIDLQTAPDMTTRCCCCSLCNTALHIAYTRILDISTFTVFIYFRRKFSFIISCILPTVFDIRGSNYSMVMNYLLYG